MTQCEFGTTYIEEASSNESKIDSDIGYCSELIKYDEISGLTKYFCLWIMEGIYV